MKFKHGNIFDEDVEALVNPVNCVGVMGQGLALWFRNNYPLNYTAYKQVCNDGGLRLGRYLSVTSNVKAIQST